MNPEDRASVKADELGWVIEFTYHTGAIWYWTGRAITDFSPQHEHALRFARQDDADRVRVWLLEQPDNVLGPRPNTDKSLRTTEHMWLNAEVRSL